MLPYALVAALAGAEVVRAGYITVGMSEARQCNSSVVEWYGDDGPYHLLLTPTQFVSHGYNVWVPSIPNGTNSYNLSINQPAGLQYMVTVWGASGIEYAGTTDVLTVLPSLHNDKSCFLTDEAISKLYTFAFNMTSDIPGYPPQCSNLSMEWPTSLESEIDGFRRRSVHGDDDDDGEEWDDEGDDDVLESTRRSSGPYTAPLPTLDARDETSTDDEERPPPSVVDPNMPDLGTSMADADGTGDTSSSNKTSGNTTIPPTMFGIIPLGNSFSIPITYSRDSKFSKGLPQDSLSDDPTTWTSKGVTHLNWTVSLAKGTRFILVAGIGSAEQWASGGSSEMMTVGQGGFDCFNKNPGAAKPSVTLTGSSTGALNRPTASTTDAGSDSGRTPKKSDSTSTVGIVLACVFSAIGTLALITCLWCCCRVRRQRRQATKKGLPKPSIVNLATFGRLDTKRAATSRGARYNPDRDSGAETQLDLIGSERDDAGSDGTPPPSSWGSRVPPINTSPEITTRPDTEYMGSPVDLSDPYAYRDLPFAPPYGHPPQSPSPSPTQAQLHKGYKPTGTRSSTDNSTYPYGYTHVASPLQSPTRGPDVPRTGSLDRLNELRQNSGQQGHGPDFFMGRQASIDGLVAYPTMAHTSPAPPPQPGPASPQPPLSPLPPRRRGPLVLHDPSGAESDEDARETRGSEDITTLKRDTLAYLDTSGNQRTVGPEASTSRPRRRRTEDDGATYLVHRDAGRVAAGPGGARGRVLELPPRYEELNWDDAEGPAGPAPASAVDSTRREDLAPPAPIRAQTHPSPTLSPSPRPTSYAGAGSPLGSPHLPAARPLSHVSDADSLRSARSARSSVAISPTASLPPGAAPPRAPCSPRPHSPHSPIDSRRSPLDSPVPRPSRLSSPAPSRHSMA